MKKITLTTIKSFIKHNKGYLHISNRSSFDGGIDCVAQSEDKSFRQAQYLMPGGTSIDENNRLGISGAWFVGSSRDYFTAWEDESFIGYDISNCCGRFILAIPKEGSSK